MSYLFRGSRMTRRRGAVAVFVMVMMVVLIGFATITVDVGVLYNTRADLQNAADAAALAGVSAYATPEMLQVRLGKNVSENLSYVLNRAERTARMTARRNASFNGKGTILEEGEVRTGWIDAKSATSPFDPNPDPADYNAVYVHTQRSGESVNGPVKFFFGMIFGKHLSSVSASAVAVYDDHFSGYEVSDPYSASVWPFTISEEQYDNWITTAKDGFTWDMDNAQVVPGPDGEVEVQLYPDELAPGNYGLLNIGTENQSTTALGDQITGGVSASDLELEIGTSALTFFDDNGNPVNYEITGNPGLKAALEADIEDRLGDVVAFFVHDNVEYSGTNVIYHITGIRFARVMDVMLQGTSSERGLWMQPVVYIGPGVITDPGAPSSDGVGRISLVR